MFICMKKINFIIHFFLKILQRNSKLAILGNLGMPGHTYLKWYHQLEEIFDVYLKIKNQLHHSRFPWDIAKILQTCYLRYFGQAWLNTPKMIVSSCRKLLHLPAGKRTISFSMFFWRYCQDMQYSYFCYFGHVWIHITKMLISTCRKFWCFSRWQK